MRDHQLLAAAIAKVIREVVDLKASSITTYPPAMRRAMDVAGAYATIRGQLPETAMGLAREQFIEDYLATALQTLHRQAEELGIVFDTRLLEALIPAVGALTRWQSSSDDC